jgi:hypothetical protein
MQSVSTASSLGKSQVSTSDSNKWTSLFTIIWKSRDFLYKQICDENWFYIIQKYTYKYWKWTLRNGNSWVLSLQVCNHPVRTDTVPILQ